MNLGIKIYSLANNQIVIEDRNNKYFMSYNTLIAVYDSNTQGLSLVEDMWDYSDTTRRYFKEYIDSFTSYCYNTKQRFIKLIEHEDRITKVRS